MAKPKSKWPKRIAWIVVSVLLVGSLALVLVEKFAPDQEYLPKSLVSLPSTVVATVIKPFQSAFAWASHGVSGYLESWKLSKTIEIEYNKLRAQNEQYLFDSLNNKELEAENERLKRLFGAYEEYQTLNPVLATVTSRETGNWFQKFTIDKGEEHGIEQFMAVITVEGLIGYVDTVNPTSSDVLTIIDSRASISGVIESSREQGMVSGTLGLDNEPTCRMYYLPDDTVPRPGDRVVTSGIGMPFPKGIPIGEVRESTRHTEENKRYFVIEPYVEFQHIEEVLVLVYVPVVEEMTDAYDGQGVYVPGPLDTPRPTPVIDEGALQDENMGAVTPPPRATRGPGEDALVDLDGWLEGGDTQDETGTEPSTAPSGADGGFGFTFSGGTTQPPAGATLAPGATPTPDPEMDALMREELEAGDNG